jgi:TRAP-type C4-dicarboxylate transport system permease small subunit
MRAEGREMKKIIANLDEYILLSMLAFSTTLIFFQVVMRYVFSNSLSWSEELARYMYVWQTWVASSYAVKKGRHLRVTSLVDKAKGKKRTYIELLVLVLWLCFAVFLCVKAVSLCSVLFGRGQTSPALGIPMWVAYSAIPAGTALMSFRLIQEIIANINKLKFSEEGS